MDAFNDIAKINNDSSSGTEGSAQTLQEVRPLQFTGAASAAQGQTEHQAEQPQNPAAQSPLSPTSSESGEKPYFESDAYAALHKKKTQGLNSSSAAPAPAGGDKSQPAQDAGGTFWEKQQAEAERIKADGQTRRDEYGLDLSDAEAEVVTDYMRRCAGETDDMEAAKAGGYRAATALAYSRMLGVDPQTAFENLEKYNRAMFGDNGDNPKTWYKGVTDALVISRNTTKLNGLGERLSWAERTGNTDEAAAVWKQIDAVEAQNAVLADSMPRNLAVRALEAGNQSLLYTLIGSASGIAGGAAGSLVGAPQAGAAIGGFVSSYALTRGSEYIDMRRAGMSRETAGVMSNVSGALQAVVETGLGTVSEWTGQTLKKALGDAAGKSLGQAARDQIFKALKDSALVQRISEKTAQNMLFKSAGFRVAAASAGKFITDSFLDWNEEGAEEFLQSLISDGSYYAAKNLTGENIDLPEDVLKRAFEQYKGGVLGAIGLGAVSQGLRISNDLKSIQELRKNAEENYSEEDYVKTNMDNPALAGISEKERPQTLRDAWKNAESSRDRSAAAGEADIAESRDLEEGAEASPVDETGDRIAKGTEYRDENGSLHTELDQSVSGDEDGAVSGRFLAGDPTRAHSLEEGGNRYGYIDFTDDGKNVTINSFRMTPGRENIAEEFFQDFAAEHAGENIAWDPQQETNIALKKSISEHNPQGKSAGLNYFTDASSAGDTRTRIQLASDFERWMPKLDAKQRAAAVALTAAAANKKGMSVTDYVGSVFQGGRMFTDQKTAEQSAQEEMLAQQGKHTLGAAQFGRDSKAAIYVTEHSDFNTFAHEMGHIFMHNMDDTELAQAAEALGVTEWSTEAQEKFADGFTDYLRTGKAPSAGLKELFRRAAEYIADVMRGFQGHVDINPQLKAVYDSLLADDGTGLAQAERAVQEAQKREGSRESYKEENKARTAQEDTGNADGREQGTEKNAETVHGEGAGKEKPGDAGRGAGGSKAGYTESGSAQQESDSGDEADRVIGDPKATAEEKTEAAMNAAEASLARASDVIKARELSESTPVEIRQNTLMTLSGKEFYEAAANEYRKLKDLKAKTTDGREITFAMTGFDEIKNHSAERIILDVIPQLKELVEKSIYLFDDPKTHGYTKKDTVKFMSYGIKIKYKGEENVLRISIRQAANGNYYYDMHNSSVADIKKGLQESVDRKANPASDSVSLTKDKLYQWIKSVKSLNPEFFFQIIGQEGAESLDRLEDRTVRIDSLVTAGEMEESGKDAKTVRLATGWERGADGKWRYEIPDIVIRKDASPAVKTAEIFGEKQEYRSIKVKDLVDDKGGLFKAYPQIADYEIILQITNGDTQGEFDSDEKTIVMDENLFRRISPEYDKAEKRIEQTKEWEEWTAAYNDESGTVEEQEKHIDSADRKFYATDVGKQYIKLNSNRTQRTIFAATPEARSVLIHELQHAVQHIEGFSKGGSYNAVYGQYKSFGQYKSLSGEVEARNAQSRIILSHDERVQRLLPDTEDTERKDQTVFFQTEDELMQDAASFGSWQEWKDYLTTMFDGSPDSGVPEGADDAWYETAWSKARKIEEQKTYSDENAERGTAAEKPQAAEDADGTDRQWYAMMQEPGKLDEFLKRAGDIMFGSQWQPQSEDEAAEMQSRQSLKERGFTELKHGTWQTSLYKAYRNQNESDIGITDRQRKTLMTLMDRAKRDYRALYAGIMNTDEWKVAQNDTSSHKLAVRIASPEEEVEALTPEQRRAVADRLDFEDLKKELKSGKMQMSMDNLAKLTEGYDLEIAGLQKHYGELMSEKTDSEQQLMKRNAALEKAKEDIVAAQKARSQLEGVRDIKLRLIKNVMHRVDFKSVDYTAGRKIIAVQSLFSPVLRSMVKRFIDIEGPYLREAYSRYRTDFDYREKLKTIAESARSRNLKRVLEIFDTKQYDKWTDEEKSLAARSLPRTDWIEQLSLDQLEKDREGSLQLDLQSEEVQNLLKETLPADQLALLTRKDLKLWTLEEMEGLTDTVNTLFREGRQALRTKQEARIEQAERARAAIEGALKSSGIVINPDDTPEEKERKQRDIDKFRKEMLPKILGTGSPTKGTLAASAKKQGLFRRILTGYGDANVRRVARMLDGGTEGVNTTQLYYREDECFNAEQRAVQKRTEKITEAMRKNGVSIGDLYKKIDVDMGDGRQSYTVDELLFFEAASKDPQSRMAVACGNMYDETVKSLYRGSPKLQSDYERMAEGKFSSVLAAARALPDSVRALMAAIQQDYAEQFDRMNEVSINEFNQPVWRVSDYVPLIRLESSGDTNANRVKEDLLGSAAGTGTAGNYVGKGMTQKRIEISPANQKPVETGLYSTWVDSVQRTEHFVAYAQYVRDLNRIYMSRDAGSMRQLMTNRYGDTVYPYLDNYIKEVANPDAGAAKSELDRVIHMLRGRTAPAYLAWKTSSIVKQFCTSPWPYMQFVSPAKYMAAALDFARNPDIRDAIKSQSAFMNSRVFDPMVDLVNEQKEKASNPASHALTSFEALGMKGLEWVDWICVAPGWLAVYRDEHARLSSESEQQKLVDAKKKDLMKYEDVKGLDWIDEQSESARLDTDEIERLAVRKADDATRMCQPSSRLADLSPMFKQRGPGSEASRVLLQFTTALNVIWQNLRYDVPNAVKQRQMQQVVGCIAGYVLAGIASGLVTQGLGGGGDDDDDKKAAELLSYGLSQFSDSVPVVGSLVTSTVDGLLTGRWPYGQGMSDMLPITGKAMNGIMKASKGDWDKAASNFAQALALGAGLPVSGAKEALRAAGIGDGDGEAGFHLEAFAGRR